MTFEIAALIVTWIAVLLLALIAVSLHLRVLSLERESAASRKATPYSHLVGKTVDEVVGRLGPLTPDVVVLVSSRCSTCLHVLEELASPAWTRPTAVAWTDGPPQALPPRSNLVVLEDGPAISERLGIRITPFALYAGPDGSIVRAGPINNLHASGHPEGDAAAVPLGRYATSS